MANRARGPRLISIIVVFLLCCSVALPAQQVPANNLGSDALVQMLARLRTTARLLHTTAHPDDDDGSMLVYETRGEGADAMMLTLNRGEGGQNKLGAQLFDELGILRTLELLEADRYYGAEQRFTRVVDFGFSKTAEETFAKWGGHNAALGDMVRVIREFRPDVIVSRFDGTPQDGHGNHQASGILSREAFRAAADPQRFPEQIRDGLLPWQAKKLYVGNVRSDEDYTLRLDVGAYDPVLGMSYAQFAREGLRHQKSQGVGGWDNPPGHLYRYYKLVDSVLPPHRNEKEQSFFDGVDTTLPGLASRLGSEETKAPFLRPALAGIEKLVDQAAAAFTPTDPSPAAEPLLAGLGQVDKLIADLKAAAVSEPAKSDLLTELETKRREFEIAASLALGMQLDVAVDSPAAKTFMGFYRQEQTFGMAVPGQTFTVTARLYNRGRQTVTAKQIDLLAPPGWQVEKIKSDLASLNSNGSASIQFRVTVAPDASYTRPYWHRDNPQESVYTIDKPQYATLALPPWPLHARAVYSLGGEEGRISAVAKVKFIDPEYGQSDRPLAVGPPLSVELDPPVQVVSTRSTGPVQVRVGVRNDVDGPVHSTVRLQAPPGWRVAPLSQPADFAADNEYKEFTFGVQAPALREGKYSVGAALEYKGKTYGEGYHVIGRHDIGWFYYYRPAEQQISAVRVAVPPGLRVGYIMGAGDDIPAMLQQLGIRVDFISPNELASGNLSRFHTIVLGIRAYDVRPDVREYNQRLLQYVANGGTLLVQYNSATDIFNQGRFTPYPATLSRERVTVEEAPVRILDPASPIFHYPNPITPSDFQGWVQERGLYFMSEWDPRFRPLLASHDPGEPAREGGLLVTRYGKGMYIYTGYAFFRQVPAGVPGAVRLFVNLLSAGGPGGAKVSRGASSSAVVTQHGKR